MIIYEGEKNKRVGDRVEGSEYSENNRLKDLILITVIEFQQFGFAQVAC